MRLNQAQLVYLLATQIDKNSQANDQVAPNLQKVQDNRLSSESNDSDNLFKDTKRSYADVARGRRMEVILTTPEKVNRYFGIASSGC